MKFPDGELPRKRILPKWFDKVVSTPDLTSA
jgi:hypothetical protein